MNDETEFDLTEEHVTLLRNAWVTWDGCEFGAPAINCKRPYGNSDVLTDLARLLHPEYSEMREGARMDWEEDNRDRLYAVHEETETALQIVLATGQRARPRRRLGWRRNASTSKRTATT